MRLTFSYTTATGGLCNVVLADEENPVPPRTQRDAVSGYRPGGRALVQENPVPDAKNLQVFTRKNRALTVEFQVERCHADAAAANKFARDELELIGKRGTLTDAGPPSFQYTSGVLESVECLYLAGPTTIHRYRFRGGSTTGSTAPYPSQ